jgi:hypothetical protein
VLVVRLGDERERTARGERLVLQRVGPERDARDGDDPDPRVLAADDLLRRRVPDAEAVAGTLEPQPEPLGQNASRRFAASTTRSTDGMYASSICQYGYGTS